jgi:sec-independent protein translocase protein TatA
MGLDNPVKIAIILVIVLLVFGAKRLPEIGKSMGKGIREFRSATKGLADDVKDGMDHDDDAEEVTKASAEPAPKKSTAKGKAKGKGSAR